MGNPRLNLERWSRESEVDPLVKVLSVQHERIRTQAEAVIQSVSWIREQDRSKEELEFVESAIRFLGKKGMGNGISV